MSTLAPVILSPYDPKWILMFSKAKHELLHEFAGKNLLIEHIGSTAIPGAIAKPEIDIMIGLRKIESASNYIKPIESIGYVYFQKFEKIVPERRYFRKSDGITPLFHIHMVEKKSEFWHDHIIFREYLKNHPKDVEKYNNLKQYLVLKYNADRENYSNGKENFIFEILKEAKQKK